MNVELFRRIEAIVRTSPNLLDMLHWEGQPNPCGTTRCIAGWAVALTVDGPVYKSDDTFSQSAKDLAAEHGAVTRGGAVDMGILGAALLGMDLGPASDLFQSPSRVAIRFLELVVSEGPEAALDYLTEEYL